MLERCARLVDSTNGCLNLNKKMKMDEKPDLNGLRVLFVEDNPVNRRLGLFMLEQLNCLSAEAENGQEAVDIASRSPFDLIFLDVEMPIMDGKEALRLIREMENAGKIKPTKIIAVTAHGAKSDRDSLLSLGMDGYLKKPYRLEDLKKEVHRVLG